MKKLLICSLIMLLSPLASLAEDMQSNSSKSQIKLEIYQKKHNSVIRRSYYV
ncbi:MAG: hypothetical protein HDS36_01280 [Bacteroides sp.]|nr:hypothetical protein [Bacteroides sp.]MDE6258609.1 hypothetical protein [Muribaculaceae bacterium]